MFLSLLISSSISDKELNKEKYQKIQTEYIDFELPNSATHYWNQDGVDTYEVIISNFSIKNHSDYILRVRWNDTRYVGETIQIHYNFRNKKLVANDIYMVSLEDYNRTCLMDLPKNLSKNKDNCAKAIKKSKLAFQNPIFELGNLTGYEYKSELNSSCQQIKTNLNSMNCDLNVSYPIYSWSSFESISVNSPENFLTIDDVDVGACGTLSTANTIYIQNQSITQSSNEDCIIISAQNITFNSNGYSITSIQNRSGIYSNQYDTTVKNTNVTMGGSRGGNTNAKGIDLRNTNNSLVFNNTARADVGYGIYLSGVSNSNLTSNTGTSKSNLGIFLSLSSNNTLTSNTGTSNSSYGIYLSSSSNNTLTSNTGTSNSSYGIYIDSSLNNFIKNQRAEGKLSGSYGIVFIDSNNTLIQDCINISGVSGDVLYETTLSINNTFLNCSYRTTGNNETLIAGSDLTRKWYYQAYINYSNGSSVPNANVSAFNVSGNLEFSVLTNASGWTPIMNITDYVNVGGTRNYYSFYIINATNGSDVGSHYFNVTLNTNKLNDVITLGVVIINATINLSLNLNIKEDNRRNFGGIKSIIQNIFTNIYQETIGFFNRISDNNIFIKENISRFIGYPKQVIESINLSELTDNISNFFKGLIQNLKLETTIDRFIGYPKQVIESLKLETTIDRFIGYPKQVIESINLSELTDNISNFFRNLIQNINLNENINKIVNFFRNLIQNVGIGIDIMTSTITEFIANLSDNIKIELVINKISNFFRDIFQSIINFARYVTDEVQEIISGGGGGGGPTTTEFIKEIDKVPVIALKSPKGLRKEYDQLQRAIIFGTIYLHNNNKTGILNDSLKTDLSLKRPLNILSNDKVTMSLEEFKEWIKNYEENKVENVILEKRLVILYNLISATIVFNEEKFTTIPVGRLSRFWLMREDTFQDVIRTNKIISNCTSEDIGWDCKIMDTRVKIIYKIEDFPPSWNARIVETKIVLTSTNGDIIYQDISIRAINLKKEIFGIYLYMWIIILIILLIVFAIIIRIIVRRKNAPKTIKKINQSIENLWD